EVPKIIESGRGRPLASQLDSELVGVGVIGEWDVGEKTAGLVLEISEHREVLDAILDSLNVAVKHRAVGANPQPVRCAMHVYPVFRCKLLVRDGHADAFAEDFGAATWKRVKAGFPKRDQHIF